MKCKHKIEETRNEEKGGYNIPEDCTTEYDIYCKQCGKYLGHWAYGNTDIEYFLNTANIFERCIFYIEDRISQLKYKRYQRKNNFKDDLPF